MGVLQAVAKAKKIKLNTPWHKLPAEHRQCVLYGTGDTEYEAQYTGDRFSGTYTTTFEGVIPNIERRYRETGKRLCALKAKSFYERAKL